MLALSMLLISQAILFFRWRRISRVERALLLVIACSFLLLVLSSMPIIATTLARSLEQRYPPPPTETLSLLDEVVILSGNYIKGTNPEQDELGGSTLSRTICGVRAFKRSNARWLIFTGGSGDAHIERIVELERAIALDMGISLDRILLEPFSHNTFEHPQGLLKLNEVHSTDIIGVVTSAWHMPRAIGRFEHYFRTAVPIPCDFHSRAASQGLLDYLPQADALTLSTQMLQEYLGELWYRLR